MSSTEEQRDLTPQEGKSMRNTVYEDFVEGVASRDIAQSHGVEPGNTARIFQQDEGGEKVIHLAGRKEVTSPIGDTLEKGGYKVKETHIRRPSDPAKEAEKIAPALSELLKGSPREIVSRALPQELTEGQSQKVEVDEAAKALKDFSSGGE